MKLHLPIVTLLVIIVTCLGIVTYKQNQEISRLSILNALLQQKRVAEPSLPTEQIMQKSNEEKRRETMTIDDRFYFVADRKTFSYNGTTGTVTHVCEAPLTLNDGAIEYGVACAGNNNLFMDLDGKRTIIKEFEPERFDETATLNDVAVVGTNLLISFNHDHCAYQESLCGFYRQISYRISLSERKVHSMQTDIIGMWDLDQFVWNASGTKGVIAVGCFEGCPEEVYQGIDLSTGKTILQIKYSDLINENEAMPPKKTDIKWKDDKTVIILGKEYSF